MSTRSVVTGRASSIWVVLVVVAVLLAACGGDAEQEPDGGSDTEDVAETTTEATGDEDTAQPVAEDVSVSVLYVSPDFLGVPIEDVLNEMRPSVPFQIESRSVAGWYADLTAELVRQLATGQAADVSLLGLSYIRQFAEAGQIQPLDDIIAQENAEFLQQFEPAFMEQVTFDGKIYALPWIVSNPVIYYNRDLFVEAGLDPDSPPETWADFREYSAAIDALGDEIVGGGFPTGTDTWMFASMLASNGGRFMNEDESQFVFNNQEAVEVLEFWKDLYDLGVMPIEDYGPQLERFIAGNQGMTHSSIGNIERVSSGIGDAFEWDTAKFAIPEGGARQIAVGGAAFVITTDDPGQQLASWEILKELTGVDGQFTAITQLGYLSPNREAITTVLSDFVNDPRRSVGYEQIDESIPWFAAPASSVEVDTIIIEAIEAAIRGQAPIQDVLDDAVAEANALLGLD